MIQFTENDIHVIIRALEIAQSRLNLELISYRAPTEYRDRLLHDIKNLCELEDKITEAPKHWYK